MQPTEAAVIGLLAWAILITAFLVGERSFRVLFHGEPANGFHPHGVDVSGFRQRLLRVHANNYENLALLIAIPILAIATDKSAATDTLAYWLLGARVLQGTIHLISTSVPAVYLRVSFYSVQLAIIGYWLATLR